MDKQETISPVELTFPASLLEQKRIVYECFERRTDCQLLAEIYSRRLTDIDDLRQSLLQRAFAGDLT